MTSSLAISPLRALLALGTALALCGSAAWAHQDAAGTKVAHGAQAATAPAGGGARPAPARKPRPQLGSGVAFAPDGALWLAGVDLQGRMFVQSAPVPAEGGWRWTPPRILDTGGDAISADGENRPKLVFGPQGTVLVAYTQPLAKPNTGYVRLLRSTDGGKTFAAPVTVHADRQVITHRFESLGFDAKGVLHTVWIDKRDLEAAPKVGNKPNYRGAAIYRNTSSDGGATFGPDIKVADHSCECCRIALGQGADGELRAMWRHVFQPNVRDHAIAVLRAGTPGAAAPGVATPGEPVRATFDDWRVDACPHHGPGLAAAEDGFHTVWFGIRQQGEEKVAGVRYGRLQADGTPRPDTVRMLPDDRAEHADVAAQGQRVAVVWRSTDGMTSTLKAWLSADGGQTFQVRTLDSVQGENDFPRLVQSGQRMVVVWRNAEEVKVHDIRF